MKVIKKSQIIDTTTVCPYCRDEVGNKYVCCGECHFEKVYVIEDYWKGTPFKEYFLEHEIIIDKE